MVWDRNPAGTIQVCSQRVRLWQSTQPTSPERKTGTIFPESAASQTMTICGWYALCKNTSSTAFYILQIREVTEGLQVRLSPGLPIWKILNRRTQPRMSTTSFTLKCVFIFLSLDRGIITIIILSVGMCVYVSVSILGRVARHQKKTPRVAFVLTRECHLKHKSVLLVWYKKKVKVVAHKHKYLYIAVHFANMNITLLPRTRPMILDFLRLHIVFNDTSKIVNIYGGMRELYAH